MNKPKRCPRCNKHAYWSLTHAYAIALRASFRRGVPLRVYPCARTASATT